ncbi:hypothetical protein IHE44_0005391 [Lamprotornis superbus]|uniref:Uncharacterized protein n=1 Tax=Lamprotornis superbus TaxID=245042 RepID=A0A835TU84_9PASS|nr:hypothetical protein IHE44_0005391 [Lamprotornis superbus]
MRGVQKRTHPCAHRVAGLHILDIFIFLNMVTVNKTQRKSCFSAKTLSQYHTDIRDNNEDGNEEEGSNDYSNKKDNVVNKGKVCSEDRNSGKGTDEVKVEKNHYEAGHEGSNSNASANEKEYISFLLNFSTFITPVTTWPCHGSDAAALSSVLLLPYEEIEEEINETGRRMRSEFYCFQLGTSTALCLSSLAPGFGLLLVYYTRGSSMKLMTKGRGEFHKRLLNKACNKPKIAGGRWALCAALNNGATRDKRMVPNPRGCMAPTCSTHSSPGEGFPISLSRGHHLANSARRPTENNVCFCDSNIASGVKIYASVRFPHAFETQYEIYSAGLLLKYNFTKALVQWFLGQRHLLWTMFFMQQAILLGVSGSQLELKPIPLRASIFPSAMQMPEKSTEEIGSNTPSASCMVLCRDSQDKSSNHQHVLPNILVKAVLTNLWFLVILSVRQKKMGVCCLDLTSFSSSLKSSSLHINFLYHLLESGNISMPRACVHPLIFSLDRKQQTQKPQSKAVIETSLWRRRRTGGVDHNQAQQMYNCLTLLPSVPYVANSNFMMSPGDSKVFKNTLENSVMKQPGMSALEIDRARVQTQVSKQSHSLHLQSLKMSIRTILKQASDKLPAGSAACGKQLLIIRVLHNSYHFSARASYNICLLKGLEEEESRGDNTLCPEEPGKHRLKSRREEGLLRAKFSYIFFSFNEYRLAWILTSTQRHIVSRHVPLFLPLSACWLSSSLPPTLSKIIEVTATKKLQYLYTSLKSPFPFHFLFSFSSSIYFKVHRLADFCTRINVEHMGRQLNHMEFFCLPPYTCSTLPRRVMLRDWGSAKPSVIHISFKHPNFMHKPGKNELGRKQCRRKKAVLGWLGFVPGTKSIQVMEILFLSVALLDAQKIALSVNYSERPRPKKMYGNLCTSLEKQSYNLGLMTGRAMFSKSYLPDWAPQQWLSRSLGGNSHVKCKIGCSSCMTVKGTFKRPLKSYLKELKGVKEYLQELMFEVLKELCTLHIFSQFHFLIFLSSPLSDFFHKDSSKKIFLGCVFPCIRLIFSFCFDNKVDSTFFPAQNGEGCLPRGKVSALLRPITHSDPCTGDKEDVLSPCLNFTHSARYPSRISFLNFMTILNRALSAMKLQLALSREQHREEHIWSPQAPFIVNKEKQAFLQCNSSHLKIDIQNMTAESPLKNTLQSFTPVENTVTCLDLTHRQLPHAIMCVITEIFLVDEKNAKLEEKIQVSSSQFSSKQDCQGMPGQVQYREKQGRLLILYKCEFREQGLPLHTEVLCSPCPERSCPCLHQSTGPASRTGLNTPETELLLNEQTGVELFSSPVEKEDQSMPSKKTYPESSIIHQSMCPSASSASEQLPEGPDKTLVLKILLSVSPLSLHALVFWLHISLNFSSCSPDISTISHYQRNAVIVGGEWWGWEEGEIKHTACKTISEAESRESEHRQNSLSVSGELAGTTQPMPQHRVSCTESPSLSQEVLPVKAISLKGLLAFGVTLAHIFPPPRRGWRVTTEPSWSLSAVCCLLTQADQINESVLSHSTHETPERKVLLILTPSPKFFTSIIQVSIKKTANFEGRVKQVASAHCCSGTADVSFFFSSCLLKFFLNSTSVLNASCKSSHNWTSRNIVNKFLGLKLSEKISNNHSPAEKEQQGLQKSVRGYLIFREESGLLSSPCGPAPPPNHRLHSPKFIQAEQQTDPTTVKVFKTPTRFKPEHTSCPAANFPLAAYISPVSAKDHYNFTLLTCIVITLSCSTEKDKIILNPPGHDFFNKLHLSSVAGFLYTVSLVSPRQLGIILIMHMPNSVINIESMMARTNFHKQQEKILLHCSDIGNTAAEAPTYSLTSLNCFAVLESEEKLLHQAISESLLSVTALEKRLVKLELPPKLNDKAAVRKERKKFKKAGQQSNKYPSCCMLKNKYLPLGHYWPVFSAANLRSSQTILTFCCDRTSKYGSNIWFTNFFLLTSKDIHRSAADQSHCGSCTITVRDVIWHVSSLGVGLLNLTLELATSSSYLCPQQTKKICHLLERAFSFPRFKI